MVDSTVRQSDRAEQSAWHLTHQWEQLAIRYCRHTCSYASGGDYWNYKDEHTLGLFLSPRPFRFIHKQGTRTVEGVYKQGDLLITPADTTLFTQADGDVHILQLRVKDTFVRTVAGAALSYSSNDVELVQAFQTHDAQLEAIAMMILAELQQESFGNQLYIDSLSNVLAIHLLRHHGTTKPQLPIYEGGLSQRQLRQVLDYIDAHLHQTIKLADLSQLVDISQFHFGRLFKQTLGLSPHQYVMQQRIELAKQLLKQTEKPIVEIALDCGFNSHSHLGSQFRRLTGMTPTAFRMGQ